MPVYGEGRAARVAHQRGARWPRLVLVCSGLPEAAPWARRAVAKTGGLAADDVCQGDLSLQGRKSHSLRSTPTTLPTILTLSMGTTMGSYSSFSGCRRIVLPSR